MKGVIRIGTRGSKLALWQAGWVKSAIEERYPGIRVELTRIKTTGDRILDVPLARIGGKGLFVKEIEDALLKGEISLAVHSMKDVPTLLPEGLHIRAITRREDVRDAFISREGLALSDLPRGAKVGTSSLRRKAQILSIRGDLEIHQLRGNLDTRLRRLDEGRFDAIVVAGAGIKRLGLEERVTEYLSTDLFLPAIGQGALGIETRVDDDYTNEIVSFLDHTDTSCCVRAERAFLERLEGGCQVPIAAHGVLAGDGLRLTGLVASVDGRTVVKDSVTGSRDNPEGIGRTLAERVLEKGAFEILRELYDVAPPGGIGRS